MTVHTGHHSTGFHIWPTGPYGRWSVVSALTVVAGQVAYWVAVLIGEERTAEEGFFDNWWLASPGLMIAVGGVAALVTGVSAMARERDRSLGVVAATVVGVVVTLFLVFAE